MSVLRLLLLAGLCGSAASAEEPEFDPMSVNVIDALECRIDPPTYNGFALMTMSDARMLRARGWRKVKGGNPFLEEFVLDTPMDIAGYRTNRIAFSSGSILAILDLTDPSVLGRKLGIESAFDAEQAISDLAEDTGVSREVIAKDMTFRKFMGERIAKQWSDKDEDLKMTFHYKVAHSLSNVTSHPGKTLYGCAYSVTMVEDE